jgi:uncharacterized membrane protein YphA (DoxX/SURF4 family)
MELTFSHPNDPNRVVGDPGLQNPSLAATRTNPKARAIVYWTMTILVAMPIGSGGVAQMAQYLGNPHGVVPVLGYPMYFFAILGFWKLLGAIAILVPRFPRLKEWAYAGIFFDLTGAAASCAAVGGYGAYGFHVIAPLILTGFTVASWALRPESRKIGVLFSAKNGSPA